MRNTETYKQFSGLGVALVTPFVDNQIDYDSLGRIVEYMIAGGVDFLVVLGSTGESNLLSEQEQMDLLDFVVKKTAKRVPIVAGNFSEIATTQLIDKINRFDLSGIDALMISAPAYIKPSQEGIYAHYMQVAEHSPLPIIIYNVPGRTISNILPKTVIRLANASKVFIGIKEASGNVIQMTKITKQKPSDFFLLSGDDELVLAVIANGGEGLISVVGNAYPATTKAMISDARTGNYTQALTKQHALYDIYQWIFKEGNPTGIKAAMEILGFGTKQLRLPLVSLSAESYQALEANMKKFKG